MKIKMHFLSLAVLFTLAFGNNLFAQNNGDAVPQATPQTQQQPAPPTQQPPDAQAPSSQSQPGQQSPDQAQPTPPSAQAQPTEPNRGTDELVGTIVKKGDKYVFQDAATGNTYDIDHQEEVKAFEGKKVRVHGTLDPKANMIHVQ